jgi:hypothetical protein
MLPTVFSIAVIVLFPSPRVPNELAAAEADLGGHVSRAGKAAKVAHFLRDILYSRNRPIPDEQSYFGGFCSNPLIVPALN